MHSLGNAKHKTDFVATVTCSRPLSHVVTAGEIERLRTVSQNCQVNTYIRKTNKSINANNNNNNKRAAESDINPLTPAVAILAQL